MGQGGLAACRRGRRRPPLAEGGAVSSFLCRGGGLAVSLILTITLGRLAIRLLREARERALEEDAAPAADSPLPQTDAQAGNPLPPRAKIQAGAPAPPAASRALEVSR